MPVGETSPAVVDARELHATRVQDLGLDLAPDHVDGPAGQAGRLRLLPTVAGGEEGRAVVGSNVRHHLPIAVEGVHRVVDVARVDVDPMDLTAEALPPQDAELGPQFRSPSCHAVEAPGVLRFIAQGQHRKDDVLLGDQEVVDHGGEGRLHHCPVHHVALWRELKVGHAGGARAPRGVREADKLTGLWVNLGVCRHAHVPQVSCAGVCHDGRVRC
mmetsp:Transcript_18950/g.60104  ORF Transcript_18950/g.60104 Transcript_18950/m.60104 type:complete len:215 (+) Transcript_18950:470-1114(+)